MPSYWTPLGSAAHEREEAALRFIAERLEKAGDPNAHLWSSFTFQSGTGVVYEVDGLLLTRHGLVVLEIKSWQNDTLLIEGERWVRKRTREGVRNPRSGADMKARCLREIFRTNGIPMCPFVASAVFLSEPTVRFAATGDQLPAGVFTHDSLSHQRPIRTLLDGSQHPNPTLGGVPSRQAIRAALDRAGIAERRRSTELDHGRLSLLGPLERDLDDDLAYTESLVLEVGPQKKHEARLYHVRRDATAVERERVRTEALREYNALDQLAPLNHSAILRPTQWVDDDRGPVLLFPHLPDHVRLDDWLTLHADASLDVRLQLARAVADPIRHAHGYGVFHRALTPGAVLVHSGWPGDRPMPDVRVTHWHAATQAQRTRHSTVHSLRGATQVWTAPELLADPHAAHAQLDVYSLGALTAWLITGRHPAQTPALDATAAARFDVPSTVRADVPQTVDDAVVQALHVDPAKRTGSVDAFLAALPLQTLEATNFSTSATPSDPDILYAASGEQVGDFLVGDRLGEGSSSIVVKALDGISNQIVALKIAKEGYEDSLRAEADAYIRLQQAECRRVLRSSGLHSLPKGRLALALTSFDNHTLAAELRGRPYDALRAMRFGDQLLEGLEELERAGVLHRDIKPSNLAILGREDRTTEQLVLFDFSLHGVPLDRVEVGTRPWLDPWVGTAGRPAHDTAVDRWAAAIVLHELLTGKRPSWGEDGQAAPDRSLRPEIATLLLPEQHRDALGRFLKQALEPQASERFRSASDMRRAWNHAFEQATSQHSGSTAHDWSQSLRGTLPQRSLHEIGLRADVVHYLNDRPQPIRTLGELAHAGSVIYVSAPSEIRSILRPIYDACRLLFATAHTTDDGESDGRQSVSDVLRNLAKGNANEVRRLLRLQPAPALNSVPWPWPPLAELVPTVWPDDPRPMGRFDEWLQRAAAKKSLLRLRQWAMSFIEAHDGIITDVELTYGLLTTLGGELHDETRRRWEGAALAQVLAWLLERHPLGDATEVMLVRGAPGAQGMLLTLRGDVGDDLARAAEALDALVSREQGAVVSSSELASTLLSCVRGRPLQALGLARVGVLAAHLSKKAAIAPTGEAYTADASVDLLVQAVARELQYRDVITLPLLRQVLAARFPAAQRLTTVDVAQRALDRAGFGQWTRERAAEPSVSAPQPTTGGRGTSTRSKPVAIQGTLALLDESGSSDAGQGGRSLDDDRWLWRSPWSSDDSTGTRASGRGTNPTSGRLTSTRHSGRLPSRAAGASDLQRKLQRAWTDKGLRLLQVPLRHATLAHRRLRELWPELQPCSVEALWREQIEAFVQQSGLAGQRATFVQLLFSGAAVPAERPTYDTLMNERIWPAVLQRLRQLNQPTLLTELAALPAPLRRSLMAECSQQAGDRATLWVLLPALEVGSAVHVVDGDPLPIGYEQQKLALSAAWCEAPLDELRAVAPLELP